MELHTLLFTIAVVLFIIEIFTPMFVAGSVAIGLCCAGVASLFGLSGNMLILIGICGTVATMFGVRPVFLKLLHKNGKDTRTNVDAMIGRTAKVIEPIDAFGGLVSLDGVTWQARTKNGERIENGEIVQVVEIDSIILFVEHKN